MSTTEHPKDQGEPFTIENAKSIAEGWRELADGLMLPSKREGETDDEWTNRIHRSGNEIGRNRQCSIGWHEECSDRSGINWDGDCECPCHQAEWGRVAKGMSWMIEFITQLPDDAT